MTHLELLNVVLTWRFKEPGWPAVLDEAGYLVSAVGAEFMLPDRRRKVVPDVCATCPPRGITTFIEVKSGHNAEDEQLERMLEISPSDLRDLSFLSIPRPDSHKVQILYVCNSSDLDALAAQVQGPRVAVAGFDGERWKVAGDLVDSILGRKLRNAKVELGTDIPPLIPFDRDSPKTQIARWVVPELVGLLMQGGGAFSADGILERTHKLVLDVMRPTGPGSKSELAPLRRRVAEVLNDLMTNEFSAWLERSSNEPRWHFMRNIPHEPAGRIRELRLLSRLSQRALRRLGEPPEKQLRLFDF